MRLLRNLRERGTFPERMTVRKRLSALVGSRWGYRLSYIEFDSHSMQSPTASPRIRAHSERVVLMHSGLERRQVQPRIQQLILLPSSSYGEGAVTDAKDSTASTPSIAQKYFIPVSYPLSYFAVFRSGKS